MCRTEFCFDFNAPFHIHDDIDILKRMGLALGLDTGKATPAVDAAICVIANSFSSGFVNVCYTTATRGSQTAHSQFAPLLS